MYTLLVNNEYFQVVARVNVTFRRATERVLGNLGGFLLRQQRQLLFATQLRSLTRNLVGQRTDRLVLHHIVQKRLNQRRARAYTHSMS